MSDTLNTLADLTPQQLEVPLYVIYSSDSLTSIVNYLRRLDAGKVGPARIDYDRSGQETDRTIVVMEPSVFARLKELGLSEYRSRPGEMRVASYVIKSGKLASPSEETGQKWEFYIPFPQTMELSADEVRVQLQAKLDALVEFGYFASDEVRLVIPLVNRDFGQAKGHAIISFAPSVPRTTIIATRIVLNYSKWHLELATAIVKCVYRQERVNNHFRVDRQDHQDHPSVRGRALVRDGNSSARNTYSRLKSQICP